MIGTGGHTDIPAYDMFYRAGGLVPVNYIIPIEHYMEPVELPTECASKDARII